MADRQRGEWPYPPRWFNAITYTVGSLIAIALLIGVVVLLLILIYRLVRVLLGLV